MFISSIEVLFIIIHEYIYACDICYYPNMSLTFKTLFLFVILLFASQRYLVFLCCWCIWLNLKLFQTCQKLILLPKDIMWDSINLGSMEVHFCNCGKMYNIQRYSLHDWHYQHFPLTVPMQIFNWCHEECKNLPDL